MATINDPRYFTSKNPATGAILWEGFSADSSAVDGAINHSRKAFFEWRALSIETRQHYLEKFCEILASKKENIAEAISAEMGKPLWESLLEVGAMLNKLPITLAAYNERCPEKKEVLKDGVSMTRHKPLGVLAVFGPFNFPGHLPNGHILPALLAGNTVIFKASELTPRVAEEVMACWEASGIPAGVIQLLQGGKETGQLIAEHAGIDGLLFTGSFKTGSALSSLFSTRPGKLLALEMGGNNPLIVHEIEDLEAAVYYIIQSAYLTTGQRCTCARRLIVVNNTTGKALISALIQAIAKIKVGAYTERPEPFMGPLVSELAASQVMNTYEALLKSGGVALVPLLKLRSDNPAFLSPSLVDVTPIKSRIDEEIFGPLLQLIWVDSFEEALKEANNTRYGLAAGLLCDNEVLYRQFFSAMNAGIIHWNRPLTGASSQAPFGGIQCSGNYRPSAYYAADYCAYPVASLEETQLKKPEKRPPGLE
jgi:succinylglutamic semialdehyde dehydrogenase